MSVAQVDDTSLIGSCTITLDLVLVDGGDSASPVDTHSTTLTYEYNCEITMGLADGLTMDYYLSMGPFEIDTILFEENDEYCPGI